MKINKEIIINIVNKYNNCQIEEIYENHKVMGNWCTITGDLKIIENLSTDYSILLDGQISDVFSEIKRYETINLISETHADENNFYECISFSW